MTAQPERIVQGGDLVSARSVPENVHALARVDHEPGGRVKYIGRCGATMLALSPASPHPVGTDVTCVRCRQRLRLGRRTAQGAESAKRVGPSWPRIKRVLEGEGFVDQSGAWGSEDPGFILTNEMRGISVQSTRRQFHPLRQVELAAWVEALRDAGFRVEPVWSRGAGPRRITVLKVIPW